MPSKIAKCTCAHPAQDKLHGKQMRVFNLKGKGKEDEGVCTVCGTKAVVGTKQSNKSK